MLHGSGHFGACRSDLAGRADPCGSLSHQERGGETSPAYSIDFRGKSVILTSRLGIDLIDGSGLGHDSEIEGVRTRTINETYTQYPGKRSRVVNRCEEMVVSLHERATPAHRWELILRAYNDGVALRYRFAARDRLGRRGDRR